MRLLLPLLLCLACATTPQGPALLRHHLSGKVATPEGLRGHVVVLNWWAEWCQPCQVELPALLEEAAHTQGQALFLAVHEAEEAEARPQVEAWLASSKIGPALSRHVVWGNEALRKRYPHRGIPTTYVLRRDGTTAAVLVGAIETAQQQERLRQVIQRAIQQPSAAR